MSPRLRRCGAAVTALIAVAIGLAGCGDSATTSPAPSVRAARLVRVPADAPTIQKALDEVAPGGMVLISPGVYHETAVVKKPDVTVRGTDRNGVVIDGGGVRPYGVVSIADGVRIENLTVQSTTFYGVLVTGLHDASGPRANSDDGGYEKFDPTKFPPLQRFEIDHVTAVDNGLYGIYAFNSQHGVIHDDYASGSADSGFYVGQCHACDILLTGNVGERNAVGFENANASAPLEIIGNRFSSNRVGMTFLSDYQEVFIPEKGDVIAGNLVADNNEATTPEQADGGFGIGIGVSGGTENTFVRNRITGNDRGGVVIANTVDLASKHNTFTANRYRDNGVDYANVSAAGAPSLGNCAEQGISTLPASLAASFGSCSATTVAAAATAASLATGTPAPAGISFLDVPPPGAQPGLGDVETAPDKLPATVAMPDVATVKVPAPDLLATLTRR